MAAKSDPLGELAKEVMEAEGAVVLTNGERLRIAAGESRLKAKARERIAEVMRGAGLSVIPEVPQFQHEEVFVTVAGSAVERLFAAFRQPSERNLPVVLKAVGEVEREITQRVATDELRELLKEGLDRLDELESGESGG